MKSLLTFASRVHLLLAATAAVAGIIMLLMAVVICFDVASRKVGFQFPGLGSTRLQELEWHFHTALFSLWIGYGYLRNVHVRVDVVADSLSRKQRLWIELFGCLLLALPYAFVACYFGIYFVFQSYQQMESSASLVGLPYRWVIKSVLVFGLGLLFLAVLAMAARLIVALFGERALGECADADCPI